MELIIPFLIGLSIMLYLMIKTKIGPFVSMLFGSVIIGLGCGLSGPDTISAITGGFGNTCKSIGIVVIFGAILGEYLEKSNASQRIATTLLRKTGEKKSSIALAATGYLVSIPVFCDVALIMLSPICKAVAKKAKILVGPVAVALACALLNTNSFVAPTPAPLSIVSILQMDIGQAILWGMIVAIICTIASWAFAHFYLGKKPEEWYTYSAATETDEKEHKNELTREIPESEMPSFFSAILPIFFPIILILTNTTCAMLLPEESPVLAITSFIGNSNIAIAIGALVAVIMLYKYLPKGEVYEAINNAMRSCGPIIFITASGGALAKVIDATGVGQIFADALIASNIPIILIPFLIAGLSKFAQGSGSVASIMAATLTFPLCQAGAIEPIIAFLAICSGSQFGSHVNNSYFWVFANLFGFDAKTSLKTLAVGQHVNALAGLAATMVISVFI